MAPEEQPAALPKGQGVRARLVFLLLLAVQLIANPPEPKGTSDLAADAGERDRLGGSRRARRSLSRRFRRISGLRGGSGGAAVTTPMESEPTEVVPANANEGCPGTSSKSAGKVSSCEGCPNQAACASGKGSSGGADLSVINDRMACVKHKLLVLSGKGGVGKSTVSAVISRHLATKGYRVGLLDLDICGPSIPLMLGLHTMDVHESGYGWEPVHHSDNLRVMSVGFLLRNRDDAVVWRGARKDNLIQQFLSKVNWGELDYLIIDTPPGTSDEHISIAQKLSQTRVDGAIIVTTPQDVSLSDVRKEINFCNKTGIRVLGVVENMRGLTVPLTASHTKIFDRESGEDMSFEVSEVLAKAFPGRSLAVRMDVLPETSGGGIAMSREMGIRYLGAVPLDPNLAKACDVGFNEESASALPASLNSKSSAADDALRCIDGIMDTVVSLINSAA
mmetsp:Transcript_1709/g.3119  ORF Transcript_1709/g.3119 Transcript_1709/m.3119 type:complete len:448 (-) Transcript_1709:84-1427(-)